MVSLEDRIRPTPTARPWLRELLGAGLLIAVTAVMLASWGVDEQRHFKDVVGQMYSFWLLLALGFTVALRQGAIDLSVWSVAALGGVVAAAAGRSGSGPGVACMAAGLAGGCVGALNGLLVSKVRIPSVIVTPATALVVVWTLRAALEGDVYEAPNGMFSEWLQLVPVGGSGQYWPWAGQPPYVLRTVFVVTVYVSVIVASVAAYVAGPAFARSFGEGRRPMLMAGSLVVSGAIAGLAGAAWLAERGSTPVPSRLLGDLGVPAAAILAGACLFAGRGRTLLSVVALGPAMLAVTVWRVEVIHLPAGGYHLQMVLLVGMTIVTQLAVTHLSSVKRGRMVFAAIPVVLTFLGVVVISAAAAAGWLGLRRLCQISGLSVWSAGAVLLIVSRQRAEADAVSDHLPEGGQS